jgi:hypothetical protein
MNTYGVEEEFHVFVTLTLEEGESSASRRNSVNRKQEVRCSLKLVEKRKISLPLPGIEGM